jgi:hypothetical protein
MTATEFTKIAVTVPTATYTVIERLRRRLGKSRSAVVALALEDWIRSADRSERDQRYIEGYQRSPEAIDEIAAVAAQATSHWQTWAPGTPPVLADSRPPPQRGKTRAARAITEAQPRRQRSKVPKLGRR